MREGVDQQPGAIGRFRRWFWRPPRAHGEIDFERTVSFLELFYDLVYVVVVAQAAHHLAGHVSLGAALEFAVIFGLVWLAWLNGTLYLDLHGQQDGRTRTFVFVQMALLALLAVFTADAGGATGGQFSLVYAAFIGVLVWLWYSVRRRDRETGREEYMAMTRRYLSGMLVTLVAALFSALLSDDLRLVVWAAIVIGWIGGMLLLGAVRPSRPGQQLGSTPTDSMVERFGLLTIIVLGEVVVGVVDGTSEVDLELATMATGFFALLLGFGLWWLYFDGAGRRLPRAEAGPYTRWMMGHFPMTLAVAAAGAAMVSLIGHAGDTATPASTAWLLGGSVALALVALIVIVRSLADYERWQSVYRLAIVALAAGAIAALLLAYLRPAPWLLSLGLVAVLSVVWFVVINQWLRARESVLDGENDAAG